jgi:hypothetical protein
LRVFLAILSTKGCELVLHRIFSYPVEIFSSSIQVTINHRVFSCPLEIFRISIGVTSSIYQHEQGFRLKEYIPAVSIFNNNKDHLALSIFDSIARKHLNTRADMQRSKFNLEVQTCSYFSQ